MTPSEPFIVDGMVMTLWPHIAHEKLDDCDEGLRAAARGVRRVHDALATYPGELPSYAEKVEECAAFPSPPFLG